MNSIFRNKDIQEKLDTVGYTVLSLLESTEIDKLMSLYQKVYAQKKRSKR